MSRRDVRKCTEAIWVAVVMNAILINGLFVGRQTNTILQQLKQKKNLSPKVRFPPKKEEIKDTYLPRIPKLRNNTITKFYTHIPWFDTSFETSAPNHPKLTLKPKCKKAPNICITNVTLSQISLCSSSSRFELQTILRQVHWMAANNLDHQQEGTPCMCH